MGKYPRQERAIETAFCHRLFHGATFSWCDHLGVPLLHVIIAWNFSTTLPRWRPFCGVGVRWGLCSIFYPRPVLAFRYCHCLRLCVCVFVCLSVCLSVCFLSVNHLLTPRDNSGPVQARIAKFGPKMQKTSVKVPIVLGGNWPWPSRSNLTLKSEFTTFWACPDHNSLPIQARITKFGPEVENSLVKVPIVLGGNWPRPSRSNLI